MCGLLEIFWAHQQVVPRHNVYHGTAFPEKWGMAQGGLVSPTLFNVVVDNVIRKWVAMTEEDQRVAHDGLGEEIRRCLGGFYADDVMVGSRDPYWLQHLIHMMVGLF